MHQGGPGITIVGIGKVVLSNIASLMQTEDPPGKEYHPIPSGPPTPKLPSPEEIEAVHASIEAFSHLARTLRTPDYFSMANSTANSRPASPAAPDTQPQPDPASEHKRGWWTPSSRVQVYGSPTRLWRLVDRTVPTSKWMFKHNHTWHLWNADDERQRRILAGEEIPPEQYARMLRHGEMWKQEAATMAEDHTLAMDVMRRRIIYDEIAARFPKKIQDARDSKRDRAACRAERRERRAALEERLARSRMLRMKHGVKKAVARTAMFLCVKNVWVKRTVGGSNSDSDSDDNDDDGEEPTMPALYTPSISPKLPTRMKMAHADLDAFDELRSASLGRMLELQEGIPRDMLDACRDWECASDIATDMEPERPYQKRVFLNVEEKMVMWLE